MADSNSYHATHPVALNRLRAIAEAAIPSSAWNPRRPETLTPEQVAFISTCGPDTVLDLLDVIEGRR